MFRPPAAQARANTFAEESTPLPWGPPIIHERSFTVLTELIGPTLRPPEGEGLHGTLPIPAVGIAMTRSTHVRDGCTPYQTFLPVSISADSVASSTERAGTMCRVSARGRAGGRDSEGQRPQARPVRLADRLLADAGDLLQLIQRPRDAVDATRGIDRGCHNRFDGPTADEALLERLSADEPRLVFHGTWQAHQRRDAVQGPNRLR